MEGTIADHVRRCERLLADEQRKPNPDNTLIATLCDSIRLTREYIALAQGTALTEVDIDNLKALRMLLSKLAPDVEHLADLYRAFIDRLIARHRPNSES